ncbi:MAG: hypothetical protein WBD75_02810 [Phycisphaerae bacterium]
MGAMESVGEGPMAAVLTFPEYDRSWNAFVDAAVDALMKAKDPVLRQVSVSSTQRAGPVQYADFDEPVTHQPIAIEASITLETAAISNTDVEAIVVSVDELAEKCLEPLMKEFFRRIGELCEKAGTAIDTGGKPASWDLVLDALERVEIDFDKNGAPKMPTFCTNPQIKAAFDRLPFTKEHRDRLEGIIAEKREAFRARKRGRRIS